MADNNDDLSIKITAEYEQAKQDLADVGRAAEEMAAEIDASSEDAKVTLEGLMRTIAELKAEMDSIREHITKIKVDSAEAVTEVADFKKDVDSLPEEKTVRIRAKTDKTAGAGGGGPFPWLGALIGAAIPALSPFGAATLSGGMGLMSMAAPAMAGAVGVGAVAKSNLSDVFQAVSGYNQNMNSANSATTAKQQAADIQKAAAAFNGLDHSQLVAAQSLQQFEAYWNSFASSFEKPILTMFTLSLSGLKTIMQDMQPVISASANAFTGLLSSMDKALNSPDNKQFFNWLAQNAQPAITAFGQIAGNTLRGVANLLMAFSGPAHDVETGLVRMTQEFYQWSDALAGTKGFQQFLQYAAVSGKEVLSLIGNLVKLVGTLLVALAPVGLVLVKLVSDIANWINQLITINPLISGLVKLVVEIATNILTFVDAVIQLFTWLGNTHPVIMNLITAVGLGTAAFFAFNAVLDANPIGLVITAIGLLITAGVEIVKNWGTIRQEAQKLWSDLTNEFNKIKTDITKVWDDLWNGMKTFIDKVGIAPYLKAYWDAIKGYFQVFIDLLTGNWSKAWTDMKTTITNIWNDIKDTVFGKMLTDAENWGRNLIESIASGIESAAQRVISAAQNVMNEIKGALGFGGSSSPSMSAVSQTALAGIPGSGSIHQYNITVNASHNVTQSEQQLGETVSRALYDKMKSQGKF